ncbi:hypothetical protein HNQ56_004242 [Anaerotaenia torta]|uniref:carbohydrate-binding protein n=1 Tax=Anaerotaenia torta TaxID=433293 RepID=UPI003D220B41
MKLTIEIVDREGNVLAQSSGSGEAGLVYSREYQEGDQIRIRSTEEKTYLMVQADDALGSAFLYLTDGKICYPIPFGEKRRAYSPKVFTGSLHYLWVRKATPEEVSSYRNLALNVMDQHEAEGVFPHATANVETRGESVFAARNAIDGVRENRSHGDWPYQSWGINRQEDARMRVDFGREVVIDKIVLYTRADFPHDNWWQQITLCFSDGTSRLWKMEKSSEAHILELDRKEVRWVELCELIKSEDPSPFPALTQIEIYGTESETEQAI